MPTLRPQSERATRPIEPPASVEFGSRPSRSASRSWSEKATADWELRSSTVASSDAPIRRRERERGSTRTSRSAGARSRTSSSAVHVRTCAPVRRTIPAPGSSPSSEASVSTSASPATTTRTALARVCQAMLAAIAVREQRLTRVAEHDDPAGALARREPVRACKPLGEDCAEVPVDDGELDGDPLELGCVDDEDVEVAGGANRSRRGLAGEQRHLAERSAPVHAADAVLRPAAVGDEDIGDARLDHVELVGGVALGDHRRAGREAAARQRVERALDLLRRHSVEHRAASRWTGCRCSMLFDRCQTPIVTLSRRKIGIRGSGFRSRRDPEGAASRPGLFEVRRWAPMLVAWSWWMRRTGSSSRATRSGHTGSRRCSARAGWVSSSRRAATETTTRSR